MSKEEYKSYLRDMSMTLNSIRLYMNDNLLRDGFLNPYFVPFLSASLSFKSNAAYLEIRPRREVHIADEANKVGQ